jgi:hypothetical protein
MGEAMIREAETAMVAVDLSSAASAMVSSSSATSSSSSSLITLPSCEEMAQAPALGARLALLRRDGAAWEVWAGAVKKCLADGRLDSASTLLEVAYACEDVVLRERVLTDALEAMTPRAVFPVLLARSADEPASCGQVLQQLCSLEAEARPADISLLRSGPDGVKAYMTACAVHGVHFLEHALRSAVDCIVQDKDFELPAAAVKAFPTLAPVVMLMAWGLLGPDLDSRAKLLAMYRAAPPAPRTQPELDVACLRLSRDLSTALRVAELSAAGGRPLQVHDVAESLSRSGGSLVSVVEPLLALLGGAVVDDLIVLAEERDHLPRDQYEAEIEALKTFKAVEALRAGLRLTSAGGVERVLELAVASAGLHDPSALSDIALSLCFAQGASLDAARALAAMALRLAPPSAPFRELAEELVFRCNLLPAPYTLPIAFAAPGELFREALSRGELDAAAAAALRFDLGEAARVEVLAAKFAAGILDEQEALGLVASPAATEQLLFDAIRAQPSGTNMGATLAVADKAWKSLKARRVEEPLIEAAIEGSQEQPWPVIYEVAATAPPQTPAREAVRDAVLQVRLVEAMERINDAIASGKQPDTAPVRAYFSQWWPSSSSEGATIILPGGLKDERLNARLGRLDGQEAAVEEKREEAGDEAAEESGEREPNELEGQAAQTALPSLSEVSPRWFGALLYKAHVGSFSLAQIADLVFVHGNLAEAEAVAALFHVSIAQLALTQLRVTVQHHPDPPPLHPARRLTMPLLRYLRSSCGPVAAAVVAMTLSPDEISAERLHFASEASRGDPEAHRWVHSRITPLLFFTSLFADRERPSVPSLPCCQEGAALDEDGAIFGARGLILSLLASGAPADEVVVEVASLYPTLALTSTFVETLRQTRYASLPGEDQRALDLLLVKGDDQGFYQRAVDKLVRSGRLDEALELADRTTDEGAPDYLLKLIIERLRSADNHARALPLVARLKDKGLAAELLLSSLEFCTADIARDLLFMLQASLPRSDPRLPVVEAQLVGVELFAEAARVLAAKDWHAVMAQAETDPASVVRQVCAPSVRCFQLGRRLADHLQCDASVHRDVSLAYLTDLLTRENDLTTALHVLASLGEGAAAMCDGLRAKIDSYETKLFLVQFLLTTMRHTLAEGKMRNLESQLQGLQILALLPPSLQAFYEQIVDRPALIIRCLLMSEQTDAVARIYSSMPDLRNDDQLVEFAKLAVDLSRLSSVPTLIDSSLTRTQDQQRMSLLRRNIVAGGGGAAGGVGGAAGGGGGAAGTGVGGGGSSGSGPSPPLPDIFQTEITEFRFPDAPSVTLAERILDLCSTPSYAGSACLTICDKLSASMSVGDSDRRLFVMKLIQQLLLYAKFQFLHGDGVDEGTATCDVFLGRVGLISELIEAGFASSFADLSNPGKVRSLRDKLMEQDRVKLALDVSTTCGLENEPIWLELGCALLRLGEYDLAREKFRFCEPAAGQQQQQQQQQHQQQHQQHQHQEQIERQERLQADMLVQPFDAKKALVKIVAALEAGPPLVYNLIKAAEEKIGSIDRASYLELIQLRTKPMLASDLSASDQGPLHHSGVALDERRLQQCTYYISLFGGQATLAVFFCKCSMLEEACRMFFIHDIPRTHSRAVASAPLPASLFEETVMPLAWSTAALPRLQKIITSLRIPLSPANQYLMAACRFLAGKEAYRLLYDFQLFVKDHARAGLTCIRLYHKTKDPNARMQCLIKARDHLEEGLTDVRQKVDKVQAEALVEEGEVLAHLKTVKLQIELDRSFANVTLAEDGQPLDVFGPIKQKCLVAELVLPHNFDLAYRLIVEFKLPGPQIYRRVGEKLARAGLATKAMDFIRTIKGTIADSDWDEMVIYPIVEGLARAGDPKSAEKFISKIVSISVQVRAHCACGKYKQAYLIAAQSNSTADVSFVRDQADKNGAANVLSLCERFLAGNGVGAEKAMNE